ncbi:MAG TPA: endonuclease MutS2 [Ktedonobacterales bacterium]|nr:endonuclease MutS2 [Ktedonobacterales bacterium]
MSIAEESLREEKQQSMHQKSLATLEYPKIVERLAREAAFSASKDLALHLQPSADADEVRRRLALTTEARRLMDLRPDVGVRGARDVRPNVAAAERGAMLAPADLIDVLVTMRAAAFVGRIITRLDDSFPLLKRLAEDMPSRPGLEARIAESISEDGEVLDSASPELRRLRADIRGAQQRLQERLNTLVNEFRTALQEPIITMRSDRYVLPVRAEARGQVRGIVHDQSGSGATVFIEPLVVVEMNNRLRELQIAERQEVERILLELSGEVAHEAPAVRLAVELLAEIDLYLAKARYASLIRAAEPKLDPRGRLRLEEARHPLLTGKVVPIDFHLGDDFSMVVITGPNTGGKTVALKTVGLLCLMAQAGLHIPAREDSVVPIFHDVFADIGDEQSIEQSLSTFSSHLSRIVEILGHVQPSDLVLLDELGAGTDPSEGSALARAILSHLLDRGVATVATTHYSELKAFAHEQPGVANASVEFDVETLSPTYHLSIGLPGRSNALAIATRLGLPDAIIERAREFLGSAGVEMESLLEGLQSDRRAAADERFRLSMERAEAEYQRRELERRSAELEAERVRILNEARAQARREIERVQSELGRIRAEVRRERKTPENVAGLQRRAQTLEEGTYPLAEPEPPAQVEEPAEEPAAGPLQVGDTVRVRRMDSRAELLSLPDARGEVEVQLGPLKLRLNARDVERLSRRQARQAAGDRAVVTLPPARPSAPVPLQLDLRGQRVDEVLPAVDQYLNDAYLAGMPFVRLLHGKGTGALRQAIREQLGHHPLVRSFESAPANEGGDGVTVVNLAAS